MIKQIILIASFLVSVAVSAQPRASATKDTMKDDSIEVPEALENNLDQLLIDWKKSLQNNNCQQGFMSDISLPDSVYIGRLYGLPSEMELVYNPIVKSYIDMYVLRKSKSVGYMLAKGDYYFPMIEEILDRNGLPLELKYLPVIESALNPIAKSRAGATGLWQFMLRTGKLYDLEINTLVDERKDPRKATEAAVRYLKDMYDIYGDWNLVIAAYNCGPGNVNKAIKRSGGLTDYWAIYPYLPKETRGYVPAFIAATYAMNYYNQHNICPADDSGLPVLVDTIAVTQNLHLKQISETLNIPIEDLRMLNPQYQKDIIPGNYKSYDLRIPSRYTAEFIKNEGSIFGYKTGEVFTHRKTVDVADQSYIASSGKVTKTHKIKQGESLGAIARKYGVSLNSLKSMNNLKSNNIAAGKTLVIQRQAIKPKVPEPKPVVKKEQNEVIQKELIAAVTPETTTNDFFAEYYSKNNGSNAIVNDSASETVPLEEIEEVPTNTVNRNNKDDSRTIYHKVRIGETVLQIANKYDVDSSDILKWNKLHSKKVKIGQRLMIMLPESSALTQQEQLSEVSETIAEEESTPAEIIAPTATVTKKQTTAAKKINKTYIVKRGDTLSKIAEKFKGITVKDIKLANNLTSNRLDVGQKLNIPAR